MITLYKIKIKFVIISKSISSIRMQSSSKIDNQIKHLNYQSCQLPGHDTQPLSRICVDKQCQNKTLICSICQQENHKSHETIPIKNFLSKFYTSSNDKDKKGTQNELTNPMYYATKIQDIKNSFFDTIRKFKSQISETLQQLESKAMIYFNHMSQKMLLLMQLQNPLEVAKKDGISQAKLKKYFQQFVDQIKIKQKFSIADKLSSLLNSAQQKQKQLSKTLTKIKTEATQFLTKMEKSLDPNVLNTLQKIVFTWSEELKGTKMKINGVIAEQTGMQSSGQRFIMLEPSLTDGFSTDKIRWGVKVIKFVGWIGVGICLKNIIKKANFFFNYSTVGHGSYMISNNGYSWSHSATQFNSAHKTFHFAQNDIVYMQYDRLAKKLRFRKNNVTGQKFQLDVVDPPPGQSYYPCANICSTGDMVQVINPGIQFS